MAGTIQIIGLGSPNGPDRVGWRLVTGLADCLPGDYLEHGLVRTGLCAAPALLPAMAGESGLLLLVDALPGPFAAGAVCRVEPQDLERQAGGQSSHGFGLQEALLLLESLAAAPPHTIIFGIGTDAATAGSTERAIEALTAAALPVLAAAVNAEIAAFLAARAIQPRAG